MTTVENRDKTIKELKTLHYSGEAYSSGQMGGCNRASLVQKSHVERDTKKSRREIANSNERKRMMSINTGFQQLKCHLPLSEDDRLSKSSVLQQAVNHIQKLEHERKHLRQQNTRLVHRLIELRKSMCGSACPCKGKCCPVDTGSQTVRERLLDSELLELTHADTISSNDRTDSEQRTRSVSDLNKQLYDVQALLESERKKTSVMENFISRILCDSSDPTCVDSSVSSGSLIVGSQAGSTSGIKREHSTVEQTMEVSQELKPETSLSYEGSVPIIESSTSRRNNLDTIVEAIRHLEGDPSSSLVKRLRLTGSVDGSLKILCSSEAGDSAAGEGIDIMDSSQIVYTVDDQFFLRQEEVAGTPAVAAFEFVSGEQFIAAVTDESEIKQDVAVK